MHRGQGPGLWVRLPVAGTAHLSWCAHSETPHRGPRPSVKEIRLAASLPVARWPDYFTRLAGKVLGYEWHGLLLQHLKRDPLECAE